jgi:nitroimidazol reductase NimA-like FMN-containing flavoprotein (pyridoxamine 5'-phosphate oxidase superfamily)
MQKQNINLQELQNFTTEFINARFMAVVGSIFENEPRTFTCWYVVVDGRLYWKSRTESEHSRAFLKNNLASLCVYDHNVKYPDDKTGVQIIGKVEQVKDRNEMEKILQKMAGVFGDEVLRKNNLDELCAPNTKSTFYSFTPNKFKLVAKELDVHMEKYEEISL